MNNEDKIREAVGHIRSASKLLDEVADHLEGITLETVVEAVKANREEKARAAKAVRPARPDRPEDTVQVVTKFKGKPLFREVVQALAGRFRSGSGTLRLVDVKTVMFEFRPYCDMKWSSVTQYAAAYMNWMLGRGYVTRPKKGTYVWVPASKRDIPLRPGEHLDEKDWEDMRKAGLV